MKRFFTKQTFLAGVAMAALVCSTFPASAEVGNSKDVLALGANIDIDTFERAAIRVGTREPYWMAVFDTLVHLTPEAELAPGLATAWSWSETGTELTLTLREGVSFTDGTAFNADAAQANLMALRDGGGENAFMLAAVEKFEITSPTEIILHLSRQDPALVENLATAAGAMASPATLGAEGAATHPIGSGPYVLDVEQTVPGRQYVYSKNPDYWDADAIDFPTLTITPISDLSARLNSLRAGQLDAALGDPTVVAQSEASGLTVTSYPVDWEGIIFVDRDGSLIPALGDVRVRRAINLAIDSASILQYMRSGHGQITNQIFSPNTAAYVEDLDKAYGYDLQQAQKLMAEAGYATGFSLTMPELRLFAPITPVITQVLGQIGIRVEWKSVAPTEAIAELQSGNYAMHPMRLAAQTSWSDIRRVVAPDASWNVRHSDDPELAALIAAAQNAPSKDERDAAYRKINEWLVDQAWFAPWYRVDTIMLSNKEVEVRPRPGSVAPSPQYFFARD